MSRAGIALFLAVCNAPAEPRIEAIEPRAVTLSGVSGPGSPLRVTVVGDGDLPSVAGEVVREGGTLVFVPAFDLSPRATYRLELGEWSQQFELAAGKRSGKPAEVVAVYPSGDVLPENQLKFYLHFSRPMSRGEAYEHIRLRDGDGNVIADPFLEIAEELWDADNRRLTLFLDPGRVKRGLKPHLEAGSPLVAGKRYQLEVDAHWKDAERRPLARSYSKSFRTVAPDYRSPDPEEWGFEVPQAGAREPLVVTFDTPLDHALLERLLEIRQRGASAPLAGEVAITHHETRWEFVPEEAWRPGTYRLVVGSQLEDLAGNSVARPFEVTEANPGRGFVGPTVSRAFEVSD